MSAGSKLVEIRKGAVADVAKASLFILDIDGVLLDPSPSFYSAAKETAAWAASKALGHDRFPATNDDDVASFKAAGGFNDDFDLACGYAWAIVARETLDPAPSIAATAQASGGKGLSELIRSVSSQLPDDIRARAEEACAPGLVRSRCAARYSGRLRSQELYSIDPELHPDLPETGLWHTEAMLCDADYLRRIPVPLAYCTGRNAGETLLAQERFELSVPKALWMVDDGECPKKPAPDGLLRLARHVVDSASKEASEKASEESSEKSSEKSSDGASEVTSEKLSAETPGVTSKETPNETPGPLVFVGDSIDDQRAALAYREVAGPDLPPIVFARVISAAATGTSVDDAAADGADIVITSLDALLQAAFPGASS